MEKKPILNKCCVCNSDCAKPLYSGILKCQQCGHVFAGTCLDDNELSGLYDKNYFFGSEYSDYIADKKVLQKNFIQRLKVLRAFAGLSSHKRLFEIGCAYGFFLDIAGRQFDKVLGIDIAEDGILYAREQLNLDVIKADFLKYNFMNQQFDVICMWDTIEHLLRPDLYLEKISNITKNGSLLALTTGDIGSLNARIRKEKWRLMHPPTHMHFFSNKTLTKILDNFGFDIIYNAYCGYYRSIDNAAYRIFVLHKKNPSIYYLLRKCGLIKPSFYLNLFDIRYVIARRR